MRLIASHVSVVFLAFGCTAVAQMNPEGRLTKLAYEVGVSYEGEEIGTEKTVCNADEWSRSIDWGDETPKETLRSNAAKTYGDGSAVPKGTYVIRAGKHQYSAAQQYTGTLYIRQRCLNLIAGNGQYSFPFTVQVFARVPINTVQAPATVVRRGSRAKVNVILDELAPVSNTRVFVEADQAVFSAVPQFQEVPARGNITTFSLAVRPNAPAGPTEVKFWTDPDPAARKSATVTIGQ